MDDKRLFGRICYLHRQMRRDNNFLFAEYGLTPVQLHAMSYVDCNTKAGKQVCQKDVEKIINLRASSVSALLTTLQKNGFIIRTVAEDDARTKYITLTDKGRHVCEKHIQLMDECDSLIESALSEEEQAQLNGLLDKIIAKIERR